MRTVRLCSLSLLCALSILGGGQTINLLTIPVYLPVTSFWVHALSNDVPDAHDPELNEAYRRYRAGDLLSARAHLYKARSQMRGNAHPGLALRSASLMCLLDMTGGEDRYLLLGGFRRKPTDFSPQALLTRWEQTGAAAPSDPSFGPWIRLFTGYQNYYSGDLGKSLKVWGSLVDDKASPTSARTLAALGMFQSMGEILFETKSNGTEPPFPTEYVTQLASQARVLFDSPRALGQMLLLQAQIEYILGDSDGGANSLRDAARYFEKDRPGWVDINLLAAIGEGRAGHKELSEGSLTDVEDAIDQRRIQPDQVRKLAEFARKLPALTGDADARTIDLQLLNARELQRWADSTGDPLLEIISLRVLSQLLRDGGYVTDASFYDAVQSDIRERYKAAIPFGKRLQTAAFLDFDFLKETNYLDTHDPSPSNLSGQVQLYEVGQLGMAAKVGQLLPGTTEAQLRDTVAYGTAQLRECANNVERARLQFRDRLKARDSHGTRDALSQSMSAYLKFVLLLNLLQPKTSILKTSEPINQNVAGIEGAYKTHAEIDSEYRIMVFRLTDLELRAMRSYLQLAINVYAAAAENEERLIMPAVRSAVAFYDKYRNDIQPPDVLDIPFSFSGQKNAFDVSLPTRTEERDQQIKVAITYLRTQHRRKLLADAQTNAGQKAADESSVSPTASEQMALAFFDRNFQQSESKGHEDMPQVSRTQDNGVPFITVKQSYSVVFDPKDDSEFHQSPKESEGLDIEGRSESARQYWLAPSPRFGVLRLARVLQTLYQTEALEDAVGQMAALKPAQFGARNNSFSAIINAGQMALSVQRTDDFERSPAAPDFHKVQDVLRSNATIHQWLTMLSQIDPEGDYSKEAMNYLRDLPDLMNTADQQYDDADDKQGSPPRSVAGLAALTVDPANRPLLFLLLGDDVSAKAAAQKATLGSPRQMLSAAEYYLAVQNYRDAISLLRSTLTAADLDAASRFQMEYLAALCYRRLGDRASETDLLLSSLGHLDQFR